ncbi:MAG: NAD(P)/FAD-dependent oxidoreductase [Solirubrobacterales bacterium]
MSGLTRRELIGRGAALGAGGMLAPSLLLGCGDDGGSDQSVAGTGSTGSTGGGDGPRVAIVGAGLAGLACAERLVQAGVEPVVFEANPDRIGGRCWSSRGWADEQVAEHGGEFIDSRHARIMALADRLGLTLDDLYAKPLRGASRIWINGRRRSFSSLRPGQAEVVAALRRDSRRVGSYAAANPTPAAKAMDETTVAEWLDENVEGGSGSVIGQVVWSQMASEFGLDATELSALNLLYEYIEAPSTADERFHVRGGNDQLVDGLAGMLPDGTVRMDSPLESVVAKGDAGYAVGIGGAGEETYDRVVLALPFTRLRQVDLERSGLSAKKRACIDELGMGTNAKVIVQTERRPIDYGGWNGYMTSDDPFFQSWESSLGQPGRAGLMTCYLGGVSGGADLAASEPHAVASAELASSTLADFERAGLQPIASEQLGDAWCDHWSVDPFTLGSYAAFLPGQYTRYYGFAGIPEGGIHFAGEHTETTFQGYLEGAVRSGERAAAEVAKAVGARLPS